MTSRQYLEQLVDRQMHADAVQFLAHALPKREAVWWACLCGSQVLGAEPPPAATAALDAAKAWVIDPKDEKRRATFPAAEAADVGTPAGCTAAAAYFSGGSLAPAHLTTVAPGEHITAQLVASALTLAAVIKEPEKAAEKYASFLRIGLEVAAGQQAWPEAAERKSRSRHDTVKEGGPPWVCPPGAGDMHVCPMVRRVPDPPCRRPDPATGLPDRVDRGMPAARVATWPPASARPTSSRWGHSRP